MQGRTWKNVKTDTVEKIKHCLIENGGEEVEVKDKRNEMWRIKFSDSTFTAYHNGTIYSTSSNSEDPSVVKMWAKIDSLVGSMYVPPSRNFLIGLDETGKGEVIGHTILAGVIFPKTIFNDMDQKIGPADTKKHHKFKYWDELFRGLDEFRNHGFDFRYKEISPETIDKYNINKIMDITYQMILANFLRNANLKEYRIVIDDYGIGPTLQRFVNFLKKQGAEVVVTPNADNNYLEAK